MKKLNILIIGSGGREHALTKKIYQSKFCNQLFAIPGNNLWKNVISFSNINVNDNEKILFYIKENKIDLVIIGPEDVLQNGLTDYLTKNSIKVFAPTKKAAMIETNKEFSKKLMLKYNIPTANYKSFDNLSKAILYIDTINKYPIVIKSSNLAQGKGVVIAKNKNHAINYLNELFMKNKYGKNNIAVIEEYLDGIEFSLMCLVNNNKIYPLPVVKDHKRINDNDQGLNTGGMGVISDLPFLSKNDIKTAINDCIIPLINGLIAEKIDYLGVIFAGIMKCNNNNFKVIEYNARWGDPETEIILEKLNCDIIEFILAVMNKESFIYKQNNKKISGVVVCAKNYPNNYLKNLDVSFLKDLDNIYLMGVISKEDKIISNSGRIFMMYEIDKNDPSKIIYQKLQKLNLDPNKFHYRKDIFWK